MTNENFPVTENNKYTSYIYDTSNIHGGDNVCNNNILVTTISNCNRTNIDESNTSVDINIPKSNYKDNLSEYKDNINIYRYKFSENIISILNIFSKIHQYDDIKTFKEAWNLWIEDNNEVIENEIRRLNSINYEGDILDKMFKSARYYFRKKSNEKKEPIKRKSYIGSQKELLDLMDKHISSNIISNKNFKPSSGFDSFCIDSDHIDILHNEINRLKLDIKNKDIDEVKNEIKNKIKKTYKNRYFMLIKINK